MDKIIDAGVFVPYAKKHYYKKSEKPKENSNETKIISLRTLWPEPDWINILESGVDIKVIATLAMTYKSIRKKPRYDSFGISSL